MDMTLGALEYYLIGISILGFILYGINTLLYNGPIISDHSSKNYREHGKIQQESEKETTP